MGVTATNAYSTGIGNGSATAFPFTFAALEASEVAVYLDDVLQSAGYSVALNDGSDGGTVTFSTAPTSSVEVLIKSNPSFQQGISFEDAGAFLPSAHDLAFDRAAIRAIRLKHDVSRAALSPDDEAGQSLPSRTSLIGKYLAGDGEGNLIASSGTGADAGLRTDLADDTGAALVGVGGGGSVQSKITDITSELLKVDTKDLGALGAGQAGDVTVDKTASGDSSATTDWRSWIGKATYTGGYGAVQISAINFQTELQHTAGSVTYAYGIQGYVRLGLSGSSTGNIETARGVEYHIANEGSGNITEAFTFYAQGIDLADGTGTVGTVNSFRSGDIGHATRISTAAYGFFQANITASDVLVAAFGSEVSSGTNRWGIYLSGGANNWTAGRVRIGGTVTAPTDFLEVVGGIMAHSSGGTVAKLGFGTSAGGAVTQATSKTTGVTLNKPCGQITMNNAALAASTSASFTLTNDQIAATDVVVVNVGSGASGNSYVVGVDNVAAGACRVHVRNVSAGSLGEALVLNFAVIKGTIA